MKYIVQGPTLITFGAADDDADDEDDMMASRVIVLVSLVS